MYVFEEDNVPNFPLILDGIKPMKTSPQCYPTVAMLALYTARHLQIDEHSTGAYEESSVVIYCINPAS
jgi:hypothetical protein